MLQDTGAPFGNCARRINRRLACTRRSRTIRLPADTCRLDCGMDGLSRWVVFGIGRDFLRRSPHIDFGYLHVAIALGPLLVNLFDPPREMCESEDTAPRTPDRESHCSPRDIILVAPASAPSSLRCRFLSSISERRGGNRPTDKPAIPRDFRPRRGGNKEGIEAPAWETSGRSSVFPPRQGHLVDSAETDCRAPFGHPGNRRSISAVA